MHHPVVHHHLLHLLVGCCWCAVAFIICAVFPCVSSYFAFPFVFSLLLLLSFGGCKQHTQRDAKFFLGLKLMTVFMHECGHAFMGEHERTPSWLLCCFAVFSVGLFVFVVLLFGCVVLFICLLCFVVCAALICCGKVTSLTVSEKESGLTK